MKLFRGLIYSKNLVEVQTGRKMKRLRTDNGWKYEKKISLKNFVGKKELKNKTL